MPTAAKLIGAALFAALAWYVSEQVKLFLPSEGAGAGMFSPINALIGVAMGWRVMGARAGDGITPSTGYGLTTIFAAFFWCLLIWSGYEMMRRAWRGRYEGPVEALEAMGDLMIDYAVLIVEPRVIGAAVIGSFICAMLTEYTARRWS